MTRHSIIVCVISAMCATATAQKSLPPDLAQLPDAIKNLSWKSINTGSLSTLEHCRALLLLNHVLDELSANAAAEADLMSTYIQKQNLGSQFASTPPPPSPKELAYSDAEKIAVAMLRGPMSSSYYATELGDVSGGVLTSYEQMYARTCQRRFSEFDESRHQVRCMASFLGNSQKLDDYHAWAMAESALRQKQHEQKVAANAPAQPDPAAQKKAQQLQQQNQQLRQALASAEYQQQTQSQQQVAQAQQQAAQAQQQAAQAQQAAQIQQQPTYTQAYAGVPAYGYGYGYGYGCAAASHYSNCDWHQASAYAGAARASTEETMANWHGTAGASAARGGARR